MQKRTDDNANIKVIFRITIGTRLKALYSSFVKLFFPLDQVLRRPIYMQNNLF